MITEGEEPRKSRSAESVEPIHRIDPQGFPLTECDRLELRERRGLSDETIRFCRLGSIQNQTQLAQLQLDWDLDNLPSTIVIPYIATADAAGLCLFRFHRRSLPGSSLPPYVLSRPDAKDIVLAESEFKAAAAWQLGYAAIALQGIWSHIRRVDEIVELARKLGAKPC